VPGGRAEPGGDQQGAEFVAVQPGRMRLIIQPRPPDVRGWGAAEEFFFDGVAVKPGDGAQAAGDGGPGAAAGLHLPGGAFDISAAGREQGQLVLLAPGGELPQVQFAGLAGQAAVASREPGQSQPLSRAEHRYQGNQGGRGSCSGIGAPPGLG
jgi:hypothetical protein